MPELRLKEMEHHIPGLHLVAKLKIDLFHSSRVKGNDPVKTFAADDLSQPIDALWDTSEKPQMIAISVRSPNAEREIQ